MNVAVERMCENNDWIAVVLFLVFVLVSLLKVLFPKRFLALLTCLFSKKYFVDYSSELHDVFGVFNGILFLIQTNILSLFIFVLLRIYGPFEVNFQFYLALLAGVNIYFISQYFIGRLTAFLFDFHDVFEANRVLKFSYLKCICLWFLPVLIFLIYGFPQSSFLLSFTVFFLLALFAFRLVLILVSNIKQFSYKWYYFILYICTLEILPLILLYLLVVK